MNADAACVIVGASLAGAKAAEALREEGFGGPIVLIGEESERPYERPPLSKDYLLGQAGRETIYVHPPTWYAEHDVSLRLGAPVTGLDPAAHQVVLADGSRAGYAKLLLATGSTPRRLMVPGANAGGVLYLRRVGDSDQIKADAVIVGIGITPNSQLAEAAGLKTGNGIITDAQLRTSDPDIYAAGDVAHAYHPLLGKHIRVDHWYNALHQPQTAARAMLGHDAAYDRVPYFYTDQYDLSMEYAGYVEPGGYDQVVFRGDVPRREFIAFWLAGGRVLADMNVNIFDVNDTIAAIVRGGRAVNAGRLADPDVPLEEFLGDSPAGAGKFANP
jgi:NADPH-dependent 2,4-dienoyl-CoA reductase/sulfur reductase-like enzyme